MTIQNILRTEKQDTTEPVKTTVKGNIPKWLSGSLFRNGPGRYDFENKYYNHLFDGAACVNKFEIKDGNVFYSNKFLETVFYRESLKKGVIGNFGSTCSFDRLKSLVKQPAFFNNTNVCIFPYMNKLYASTETNIMNQLDPKDMSILKTINIEDHFNGFLRNSLAHSHTLRDGSWINMGWKINRGKGGYFF
jgi:carotenoid cleavage dioxygenase-like enzyme